MWLELPGKKKPLNVDEGKGRKVVCGGAGDRIGECDFKIG